MLWQDAQNFMFDRSLFNASVNASCIFLFVLDKVQYQTQGRFFANTRKLGYLVDSIFN